MSSPPYVRDLLSIADKLTKSLSDRISKSSSLQKDCDDIASKLRNWRKNLPTDMEFLLKPTGDKALYRTILSPLSEMLCILCQLIWTAHELGKPPSLETISRTNEAEQKIKDASPVIKKFMDDLGVWQKPRKNHAPLAVLFDKETSRNDRVFQFTEKAVHEHLHACCSMLLDLTKKIGRARSRYVGLRLLGGNAE